MTDITDRHVEERGALPTKRTDEELDEELEGTFPASDPPSLTEPSGQARKRRDEPADDGDED